MHKNTLGGVIGLILLIVAVIGCNAGTEGRPAAEKAVERFHNMLNDERYAEIYADLDPKFKEVTTEQEMTDILQAVHIKLGKVVSSKNQMWRANSFNLETQLIVDQETQFEQGKASEEFRFLYSGKKVSLFAYNINSKELITK